jgi:hypothetical protein
MPARKPRNAFASATMQKTSLVSISSQQEKSIARAESKITHANPPLQMAAKDSEHLAEVSTRVAESFPESIDIVGDLAEKISKVSLDADHFTSVHCQEDFADVRTSAKSTQHGCINKRGVVKKALDALTVVSSKVSNCAAIMKSINTPSPENVTELANHLSSLRATAEEVRHRSDGVQSFKRAILKDITMLEITVAGWKTQWEVDTPELYNCGKTQGI